MRSHCESGQSLISDHTWRFNGGAAHWRLYWRLCESVWVLCLMEGRKPLMPWCSTVDCRSKRSFKKMDQPCGCRNRPSLKLYVKAGRHSWRSYLHIVLVCVLDLYKSCCCSASVEGPEAKTTETQILEVLGQWLYHEFAGPARFGRLTVAKRTHPACFHFCRLPEETGGQHELLLPQYSVPSTAKEEYWMVSFKPLRMQQLFTSCAPFFGC